MRGLSKQGYVRPFHIAQIYNAFGETDETFAWLDRAVAERDSQLSLIQLDYRFDGIRGDPRLSALLKRMHLP